MMYKTNDGERVFHKHSCPKGREGQVMTAEELHDFAVEALMSEYAETGAIVTKYKKKTGNEADFRLVNTGKNAQFRDGNGEKVTNILVVCRNEFTKDISDIDSSWLVDEYYRTGAMPRVTLAMWNVDDDSDDNQPAVCGGEFCFKYYSVSVLPDQENEELDDKLTPVELAAKYAETWEQTDAGIVAPYLDKDFHYGSKWVFDEFPSRREYLDYFEGKLAFIKRSSSQMRVSVCRDHQNGKVAVLITYGYTPSLLELETEDGRITSAHMDEYDGRYKIINPKDELYMTHGDHQECIMPIRKLKEEHFVKERTLGDMATDFEEFMYECDFKSFGNLMFVMEKLPLLKIRDGYELDAFQCGNDHGWFFQPYCCQAGADVHYMPEEHGDYVDALRIHGRIDFKSAEKVPAVLSYMEVPFTEEGILQAWLLDNLTDFMPRGWHANYGSKDFIFDESHVDGLFPDSEEEESYLPESFIRNRREARNKLMALDKGSLLPSVSIKGNTAVLEYAYWSNWSGMNKVKVSVKKVGNSVEFGEPEREVIVSFNCGIKF